MNKRLLHSEHLLILQHALKVETYVLQCSILELGH